MTGFGFRLLLVFLLTAVSAVVPVVSVLPAQAVPQVRGASTAIPGDLNAVSASSASNAWAVGNYCTTSACSAVDTLAMRWNGTKWSKVTSPTPGSDSVLDGVDAVSVSNAWAVGNYCTTSACSVTDTMILHWNGTKWSKVTSPNPSSMINELSGVYATSATNAWAVGQYFSGTAGPYDTLILHWNGTAWSKVTSPHPSAAGNFLSAVSATSASDAWAVGSDDNSANISQTLALHWNGTAWSQVTSPSPSTSFNTLSGVSATSGGDAWAVGIADTATRDRLILHWNGSAWSPVGSTAPATSSLAAVSAISRSEAWAAGQYCLSNCSSPAAVIDTLILRWNGTNWSKVTSPSPSSTGRNLLLGITATAANNAWAVGDYPNSSNVQTVLILHWNGTKWSQS